MLSSIHPLGERSKANTYLVTAAAHIAGAALGGALLGVLLGVIGVRITRVLGDDVRLGLLLVAVTVAAGLEAARSRPPSWRRQVNEDWLTTYRGWVYGVGFGAQLGAAVVTIITSSLTYVMVAAALLVGSLWGAVAIAATFGIVRGATILAAIRVHDPDGLVALHRGLAAAGPRVAQVAAVAMGVCALGLTGALLA